MNKEIWKFIILFAMLAAAITAFVLLVISHENDLQERALEGSQTTTIEISQEAMDKIKNQIVEVGEEKAYALYDYGLNEID